MDDDALAPSATGEFASEVRAELLALAEGARERISNK